ncbi:hypothetical protein E4V01_13190 [Methylorubrum sp. Q1]|uniref:hypothetical protein n=1 Tax=Methylorubrum sp. Q1 TaxID=2562453 RepID=UPI001075D0C5|nr:hypothetical protein [Methylorubrum sp. Q1]TFZ57932.1 hypothetical protein E4V01_13190 [Methylorubrum sp. Q1]
MASIDPIALTEHLGRLVDDIAVEADTARTGGDILRLRDRLKREWDGVTIEDGIALRGSRLLGEEA